MFQMQDHNIIPVFIIHFNDNTQQIMPFLTDIKSTFYRKINEIAWNIDFESVTAIFFVASSIIMHQRNTMTS